MVVDLPDGSVELTLLERACAALRDLRTFELIDGEIT
jgi:hypothetical protein